MRRQLAHGIDPLEAVGLRPLGPALRQCLRAVVGDEHSEPSRWGTSSLAIFRPWLGPATWAGWAPRGRRIRVLNYFNRADAPPGGYDVRVTHVRDWRGGKQTYNSHVGTDFVVPVGTRVLAPAPGRVVRVENLMYRGGLKVVIDHGEGLLTLSGHLARATVQAGDEVARGALIGLSGFSAIDGILFFPWVPPHVHFTTLLDGAPIDPFAGDAHELALWREGNDPGPARPRANEPLPAPTAYDEDAVRAAVAVCQRDAFRREMEAMPLWQAAGTVRYWQLLDAGAMRGATTDLGPRHERRPILDLPFDPEEVEGLTH